MMDIFFISFNECNRETNWARVQELHPNSMRLHGIKGIDRVHLLCDQISTSEYFWTVDGDNYLTDKLEYNDPIDVPLIMFKALDPIHKTLTSLGGVKLWKKGSIVNPGMNKGDFCLNATSSKKVLDRSYSITTYNASPFDAWKTSFRHCVKLLSIIFKSRPNASNLDYYINQWKSCKESMELNSSWAYQGYIDAEQYVKVCNDNLEMLYKINDYDWLTEYYYELHH